MASQRRNLTLSEAVITCSKDADGLAGVQPCLFSIDSGIQFNFSGSSHQRQTIHLVAYWLGGCLCLSHGPQHIIAN